MMRGNECGPVRYLRGAGGSVRRTCLLLAYMMALASACSEPEGGSTSSADANAMPVIGSETCRQTLECALYCDGPTCAPDCLEGAPDSDVALVSDVLACLATCPDGPERGPCIAERCFEPYRACYVRGQTGDRTCADTWTCFGDCGDEPSCIDSCLAQASMEGLRQFVAVEVCSDTYVTTVCEQPDCDADALSTVCQPSFFECLDAGLPDTSQELQLSCQQAAFCEWSDSPREVEDCERTVRRALAGCPTADKQQLLAAQSCLANAACTEVGWRACPGWVTSDICQEITGPPQDGVWP